MYLKSLKLAGFKSFADRTRFEFRPGVTVVVGPNGSGKSNVVDSLSWVLGTQSTKTLRTQRMDDVIFAGTASRPSLGKAEATLVVDNSERRIDLDLDEISITRRLYRDGSSDYELNGVACRLNDILDLLSDSGVGRHQHVIIGQGEIGRILNASPEEHRAVIEEAAGILKHRRRKERAERRLQRTDEDMIRLTDLLHELNRQMRPLRRQAKAAERYDGLKAEVVALSLFVGGLRLSELDRSLVISSSEKAALSTRITDDGRRLGELEESRNALAARTEELSAALDGQTTAAARLETTMERLRRISSIASERARAVTHRREAVDERRADIDEEISAIVLELEAIVERRNVYEAEATDAEAHFRRLDDEEQAIATQNALSPEGALAAVRGELSVTESALRRDNREIEAVERRIEVLTEQRAQESREIDRINGEIKAMDAEITRLQRDYERASQTRTGDQADWEGAEHTLDQARIDMAAATARHEAVMAALDGPGDVEARRIVESAEGAVGSLMAQLDVPPGLESAVGAALGGWADAIAFSDPDRLEQALRLVKQSGGRSVALVTSMSHAATPAVDVARSMGLEALVEMLGPRCHSGLAARLLGDVILVEGWSTGWSLVARHPALRAVTPDGDVISVAGVRVADPDGAGAALREPAELALENAGTALARAESIHATASRVFERSRGEERSALELLEQAEASMAGRSEAMNRLQMSVRAVDDEIARLELRRGGLREAVEAATRQSSVLERRLAALEGEEAERLRAWEEMETRRIELVEEREQARSAWQEASSTLQGTLEREQLLRDRVERITTERERLDPSAMVDVDPEVLEVVTSHARRALSIIEAGIGELRDRQAVSRELYRTASDELAGVRMEHEELTGSIGAAKERIGELDVALTEIRLRREAVIEKIGRDADSDELAAMSAPRPPFVGDEADIEELMESKSAQLQRLGPINPLAATEYAELEERHTFISDQLGDVESSRAELRKVISTLEDEIRTRFDRAFEDVSNAYRRYFEVLFPGGRGKIRVTEDEDQPGVLIDAQPHGKKVSQMTLLSGGERSLAALAFLFAVFEARPSPFYVLDEVEAALDDANLRRFLRIVQEFRGRAQLIIVTHQQQTMEAADVLYGVTMEPGGSSQAVRKDMGLALQPS